MFDEMKNKVIGGVAVLLIGGTGFAVSQTDVINNFAKETGMSQQEAQEYADNIKDDLASFTEIGDDHIKQGNEIISSSAEIDCINYAYDWESPSLGCENGKAQLLTIGNGEVKLGNCYRQLDTDLGDSAKSKINECITNIDQSNNDYTQPIASALLDANELSEAKKTNAYNKSVLKSALDSDK